MTQGILSRLSYHRDNYKLNLTNVTNYTTNQPKEDNNTKQNKSFLFYSNKDNISKLFMTNKKIEDYSNQELYYLNIILIQDDTIFKNMINQYSKIQINNLIFVLLNIPKQKTKIRL